MIREQQQQQQGGDDEYSIIIIIIVVAVVVSVVASLEMGTIKGACLKAATVAGLWAHRERERASKQAILEQHRKVAVAILVCP